VRVELVHHSGCRFAQATHDLLQECLTTLAIPAPVHVRVADHPSPTLLINGIDVMGASPDQLTASACRLDIPTREQILTVLTAQLTAESTECASPGRGINQGRGTVVT
jgi:hypothetical protein